MKQLQKRGDLDELDAVAHNELNLTNKSNPFHDTLRSSQWTDIEGAVVFGYQIRTAIVQHLGECVDAGNRCHGHSCLC